MRQAHWITQAVRINTHFLPCKRKYLDAQLGKWNYLQYTQMKLTGLYLSTFFLLKGIKETALHLAVRLEEKSSLALVDFLCQNRSDPAQVSHKSFTLFTRLLALISIWMFTSQQLSGEENSRRKHSASLQRPSSQARVSKTAPQSEGSPAHRCHFQTF